MEKKQKFLKSLLPALRKAIIQGIVAVAGTTNPLAVFGLEFFRKLYQHLSETDPEQLTTYSREIRQKQLTEIIADIRQEGVDDSLTSETLAKILVWHCPNRRIRSWTYTGGIIWASQSSGYTAR